MMSSNAAVNHTKKRKANDGRATVPDGAHDVNTATAASFYTFQGSVVVYLQDLLVTKIMHRS